MKTTRALTPFRRRDFRSHLLRRELAYVAYLFSRLPHKLLGASAAQVDRLLLRHLRQVTFRVQEYRLRKAAHDSLAY